MFLIDLEGLRCYTYMTLDPALPPHVVIPLLGRFKSEIGTRFHLTPIAAVTASGIQPLMWITRLLESRANSGQMHYPAFGDTQGNLLNPGDLEVRLLDCLQQIQLQHPELTSAHIIVHEEYGTSHSFRRGTTSEARARGVHPDDIDLVNRWRIF